MNKSFDSEYINNLAAGFVVDDLTPEEAEEFRLLINEHPELITEVDDLQEVLRQVLDGFTQVEAPAHLLPKILEQAQDSAHQTTGQEIKVKEINKSTPTQKLLPWRIIFGSIAVLCAVALGVDNYRLRQNLGIITADNQRLRQNLGIITADNQRLRQDFAQAQVVKTMLQNEETRLFTFKGVNSAEVASGSIMINREQQKAVMLFQNLPAPPSGYVYLLWTVVASEKLPCGEVKPYLWGNAAYELPFTNQMYKEFSHPEFSGIIVTLEKDPNVSRPTGTVIMKSSQI